MINCRLQQTSTKKKCLKLSSQQYTTDILFFVQREKRGPENEMHQKRGGRLRSRLPNRLLGRKRPRSGSWTTLRFYLNNYLWRNVGQSRQDILISLFPNEHHLVKKSQWLQKLGKGHPQSSSSKAQKLGLLLFICFTNPVIPKSDHRQRSIGFIQARTTLNMLSASKKESSRARRITSLSQSHYSSPGRRKAVNPLLTPRKRHSLYSILVLCLVD